LLGGEVRDEIRLYANTWFLGAHTPDEYARRAEATVAKGWDALKWDPFPGSYMAMDRRGVEQTVANVRAVREAVGLDVDLLIETHGRLNADSAIRVGRELEQFNPFFYEEPVPPHNPAVMRKVRQNVAIPIAAGERRFTRWGMRPLLENGAVDILQPDMTQAGGLWEAKKIAAIAESYQVLIAPHCPRGPVAVAAGVHFAASTPNFLILEYATDEGGIPWRQELFDEPERVVNGRMALPERPGLGLTLNETAVQRHKAERLIRRIPGFFNESFTIP
jgi:galactonate dehydratase